MCKVLIVKIISQNQYYKLGVNIELSLTSRP